MFKHLFLVVLLVVVPARAQLDGNFSEAAVPAFTLPDPLRMADGTRVGSIEQWNSVRRPQLLRLFAENIYGVSPPRPQSERFIVTDLDPHALGGLAIRKQVTILLNGEQDGPQTSVLIYLPAHARKPVPVFVGLNFHGNQAINPDPAIQIAHSWVVPAEGIVKGRATVKSRGIDASQWPLKQILDAGYGIATFSPGDLYPDGDDKVDQSIQPYYHTNPSDPAHWGAIATWAWGLSAVYDCLAGDPDVDSKRVIVFGHSRYGKAALWTGASDPRFAMVISNESGNGGASLYRRDFGETIRVMNNYWFAPRFKTFAYRESDLPVDANELIALIAPRPVYVASATEDLWSDPRGEFLAARGADSVYHLFGYKGIERDATPAPDHPIGDRIGYHIRTGKHDITPADWAAYIAFAERNLKR